MNVVIVLHTCLHTDRDRDRDRHRDTDRVRHRHRHRQRPQLGQGLNGGQGGRRQV